MKKFKDENEQLCGRISFKEKKLECIELKKRVHKNAEKPWKELFEPKV